MVMVFGASLDGQWMAWEKCEMEDLQVSRRGFCGCVGGSDWKWLVRGGSKRKGAMQEAEVVGFCVLRFAFCILHFAFCRRVALCTEGPWDMLSQKDKR